jgi:sterol desaturase/sphingolipid hydroxylase (fatty acid hydroxylase superfamily)
MNPPAPGSREYSIWKGRKSLRMFEQDGLERWTHVHPLVPLFLWGPVSLLAFYGSLRIPQLSAGKLIQWMAVGLFVWTLTEYLLHRFLFHWHPRGKGGERFHFLMHGVHHEDPNDPTRLVMPWVGSLSFALLLIPSFRWMLGPFAFLPFLTGFLWGYLSYEYTHYTIHHFSPRTPWGKMLKDNHLKHHFVDSHSRWGVSSPLWDWVLRTQGK